MNPPEFLCTKVIIMRNKVKTNDRAKIARAILAIVILILSFTQIKIWADILTPSDIDLFIDTNSQKVNEPNFLEDMDLSSKRLDCGKNKCFIHSISDKQSGFLVARNNVEVNITRLNEAYDVAKWIKRDFGGRHFFHDDPPYETTLPEEVQQKINRIAYITLEERSHDQFLKDPLVVIQKVKKAPQKTLFFGCVAKNKARYETELEQFSKIVCKNGMVDEFMKNSEKSYNIAKEVFQVNPSVLWPDFQALYDSEGHLYYIDIDGPLGSNARKKVIVRRGQSCLDRIKDVGKDLSEKLEGQLCG